MHGVRGAETGIGEDFEGAQVSVVELAGRRIAMFLASATRNRLGSAGPGATPIGTPSAAPLGTAHLCAQVVVNLGPWRGPGGAFRRKRRIRRIDMACLLRPFPSEIWCTVVGV